MSVPLPGGGIAHLANKADTEILESLGKPDPRHCAVVYRTSSDGKASNDRWDYIARDCMIRAAKELEEQDTKEDWLLDASSKKGANFRISKIRVAG